jgi:hypothetical protein
MTARVDKLIGVYHADGGLLGELRYIAGRALGRTHCALCDLTHHGVRPRSAWGDLCRTLPIPVELVHLNQRSDRLRRSSDGHTPCVLAEVGEELVVLLGPDELEACHGDLSAFEGRLRQVIAERGLHLG